MRTSTYREMSDEDLMLLIRDHNDEDAFEALYSRHYKLTRFFFFRKTGSADTAEDLTQEVWVKLHTGRAHFEPGCRFGPWFRTMMRNVFVDWLRRKSSRIPEEATELEDDLFELEPHQLEDFAERFKRAWERLSPEEQEILALSYQYGYSKKEVGQRLRMSQPTLRRKLKEATKSLAGYLEEEGVPVDASEEAEEEGSKDASEEEPQEQKCSEQIE